MIFLSSSAFSLPSLPLLHSHHQPLLLCIPVWVRDPESLELRVGIWLSWLKGQFPISLIDVKITVGY